MEDRVIMDNLLSTTKAACDLMMHGAIESANKDVYDAFNCAFNDTLSMQNEIYNKMVSKGWYPTQQIEQQKINTVKQKYYQ